MLGLLRRFNLYTLLEVPLYFCALALGTLFPMTLVLGKALFELELLTAIVTTKRIVHSTSPPIRPPHLFDTGCAWISSRNSSEMVSVHALSDQPNITRVLGIWHV